MASLKKQIFSILPLLALTLTIVSYQPIGTAVAAGAPTEITGEESPVECTVGDGLAAAAAAASGGGNCGNPNPCGTGFEPGPGGVGCVPKE